MTTQREPTIVLDPRARAMLLEMGVRVWSPSDAPLPLLAPAQVAGGTAEPGAVAVPVRREPPLRLPVMDAPPISAALGVTRYVIANLPAVAANFDVIVLGEPCQGAAEQLLANLLKPLGLSAPRVFIAHMVASHNDAVNLQDQLTTMPAKLVLALGPHAAKALLGQAAEGIPFSKLRGTVHAPKMPPTPPIIVTYHPQQLLRQPAAKASSWQDLRLVLRTIAKS
jgi:uracil-DNA glycosylase